MKIRGHEAGEQPSWCGARDHLPRLLVTMQLQHLRAFYEVATSGSFTRAAEKLYLTQPAVTQQVRALEAELGFPLIERRGRRIRLTEAGDALLAYPPRLLALLDEGLNAAREAAGRAEQTLRLGAGDTVATY